MLKVAIVILADTETHEALGRAVNAMEAVKEFKQAGDDVQLIFDGAATKWIGELTNAEHPYHELYQSIADHIGGACEYCANAFGVSDSIKANAVKFSGDFEGHPSFRQLLLDGYQVITF